MAEEITLKINSNIDDARKDVEKLTDSLDDAVDKTEDLSKASKKGEAGIKKLSVGFKALAKATGIVFILNKAFEVFQNVLGQNQKVVDIFNTATEFLNITFNKFFNFLSQNTGKATGFISKLFGSEAVQNALTFGRTLGVEIITRIKNLIQGVGGLGKALFQAFKGDFKEASETAKTALGNLKDTVIGNTVETAQMDNAITKVTDKIKNFTKSTLDSAKANVELDKSAALAESRNRILLEQFDAQAEKLRQIRDDENLTFEQRIEANNQLGELLKEQNDTMLANADIAVDAAQKELDKNKENIDLQIALNNAIADREGIIAQVTGFESEQLQNTISLTREKEDLEKEQHQKQLDRIAEADAANQAIADANKARKQEELAAFSSLAGALGDLAGENKVLAIAQATIDTFAGANKALGSAPPPVNFIQAAAVTLAGIANVRKILETKVPKEKGGGGLPSVSGGTPAPQMVSGGFELTTGIAEPEPTRAFVVSDDISQSQDRLATIRRRATFASDKIKQN